MARFALLLLLILPLTAHAQQVDMKLVDQILAADNLNLRLKQWLPQFDRLTDEKTKSGVIEAAMANKIKAMGKRIYKSSNLKKIYRLAFAKQLQGVDLKKVLEWQNSPVGKKVREARAVLYRKDVAARASLYAKTNKLESNRLNVLRSTHNSSRLSQNHAEMMVALEYGVEMTGSGYQGKSVRGNPLVLRRRAEIKRLAFEKAALQSYTQTFTFAMRGLSNRELEAYRKFCDGRYGQLLIRGQQRAIKITGDRAAKTARDAASQGR